MSLMVRDSLEAAAHNNTQSSSEYLNALETAFGTLPPSLRTDFLENQARTHGNLSDAILQRISPSITTKISGLLTDQYYSPYTSYLLPYRRRAANDSAVITWNEIHFSEGIATPVQSEGVPRLHTSEKISRGDKMIRRGTAVTIDTEFYQTPEGREMFALQIQQLAAVTQRANEMDVLLALLRCKTNARHAWQLGGNFNFNPDSADMRQRIEADIQLFGLVNKTPDSRGLRNVLTRFRTIMERNGVQPDSIVLPPFLLNYYYLNKPDLWEYSRSGDAVGENRALANRTGDPTGVDTTRKMDGLTVVDTHLYRTTTRSQHDPVDMLTAPRQIGEFCVMTSKYITEDDYDTSTSKYKVGFRDIRMYDERQDRMEVMTYKEALYNCVIWNDDGSYRFFEGMGYFMTSVARGTVPKFGDLANFDAIFSSKKGGAAIKDEPITRENAIKYHEEGKYIPFDLLLARPYALYNCSSMIIMKAGEDTGSTYIGWTDFQMTANTMQKMISGSYTFLSKAVVRKDENVTVANDVFIQSYIKGFDLSFINSYEQFSEIANLGGLFDQEGSILCFPLHPGEDIMTQNIIDIRGRHPEISPIQSSSAMGQNAVRAPDEFFSSGSHAASLLKIDDLSTTNISIDQKDYEELMFKANTICAHGNYDVRERGNWRPIRNRGYLGNIVYDGVGQSRDATNHVPLAMEFGVTPMQYEMK